VTVPPWALAAADAARAIRDGRLTSVALVEACLERIAATEPGVQAWVVVDAAGARRAAARLDATRPRAGSPGPLHGVPVGVKDIFDVAGLPTRAGARVFAERHPDRDAAAVARLRAAGAVILGKLHTTEFAHLDPAPTRNPWDPGRTPGGSSSGSAAAVAARMVPAALGSQTVGSTVRPAAYCGVVGFKPGYGRISRRGMVPGAWSLDHVGLLTRTVGDAALLFSVLAPRRRGGLPAAPGTGPRPPRLALARQPLVEPAGAPDPWGHVERIAGALAAGGATVEPVTLPSSLPALLAAVRVVVQAEVAAYHADLHRAQAGEYGPGIRAAVEAGACVPAALYLRAQRVRAWCRSQLVPLLEGFDALLVPAADGPAPWRGTTGDPSFNAPWSGIGAPQVAVPTGRAADGLPLAVQLVGAPGAEDRLLDAARWVESAVGFHALPPLAAAATPGGRPA
jgi:aspartyl-tRNA(Asn)/glutamyl-tRNA(Gln) amidotransferase subunit A